MLFTYGFIIEDPIQPIPVKMVSYLRDSDPLLGIKLSFMEKKNISIIKDMNSKLEAMSLLRPLVFEGDKEDLMKIGRKYLATGLGSPIDITNEL